MVETVKNKLLHILIFLVFVFSLIPAYSKNNEWEILGSMPFPVYNGESILYNSKIYILGGYNPLTKIPTDTINVYDPVNQSWDFAGIMSAKRAGFVADLYQDTFVIYGGTTGDTTRIDGIEMWDSTGTLDIIALGDSVSRINSTGGIYNDHLYLFGGYTDVFIKDSAAAYILEYDIPDKSIFELEDNTVLGEQLLYQELAAFCKDNFFIFGGVFFGVSKKVNKFNVITKEYERIHPDLFQARAGGKAVTSKEDEIFIIGGFNETKNALETTEILKIFDNGYQITPGPSLNYARKQFMAELHDGYIYVFGGLDENDKIVPYIERIPANWYNTNVKGKLYYGNSNKENAINFYLLSNYPNPFNAVTTIAFRLDQADFTSLDIFTVQGRKIKTLLNNFINPGIHKFLWDGTDENNNPVASNLYFCKLTVGNNTEFIKILLIK